MGLYGIRDDYEHRKENCSVETQPGEYWNTGRLPLADNYQYHAYLRAAEILKREGLRTVYDVGCGPGNKLNNILAPISDCIGLDQAPTIQVGRRLFPKVKFQAIDLENPESVILPPADLIICADVIEHLVNPDSLLVFLRRLSHANTRIVLSTPDRDRLRGPGNLKSPKPEHVREWNFSEFANYLSSNEFDLLEHFHAPAFRTTWNLTMLKERWNLVRKGVPLEHMQVVVCRPKRQL